MSDGSNLEWKWAAYVPSTSDVIPNDFRLYQTIPAEKLEPGIYEVNARMWQYASKLGITRLYGKAGNKCAVQYYGVESKYPASVLTEGETATFAGLSASTTTGRVNNMALDIEVGEGEDLEIGVKSGYGAEATKTAGANPGKVYVDLIRTWKVSDLPVAYDENASDNLIVPRAYNNKVVLNKTFTNGEWQFVCFPFSLNAADIETIFGKGTEVEGNTEAGTPFRIRPTDALPSPVVLEHVRISTDAPQVVKSDGYVITGTFQKTDKAQAFSAFVTEDPDGIKMIDNGQQITDNDAKWYDPLGRKMRNDKFQKGIYVAKGKVARK